MTLPIDVVEAVFPAGRAEGASRGVALRPPLKWAGGKRWQVPYLRRYWTGQTHRRFVEPFCGGLAVSIGLTPERALLNDVNAHVINLYRWLKRGFAIADDMVNSKHRYYECRVRFNRLLATGQSGTAEAAALFYYLNRTGYNGLCRFNRSGRFNVPFGRYARIGYKTDFGEYKKAFARWTFVTGDFEALDLHPTDLVYADPPYDVEFTQYSQDGFDWNEQERSAVWLSKHKGPVILSNQATPRIVKLYKSLRFNLRFLDAPRRISCTGDRTPAQEVLALRNIS